MIARRNVRVTHILLAVVLALSTPWLAQAQNEKHYTRDVRVHASQNPETPLVPGASATLETDAEGATTTFHTMQLEPGHVYTLWWVIVNAPERCAAAPCAPPDILSRPDEVRMNVTYGGGQIASESGEATFEARLPAGDVADGWFDNAFDNPTGAEIHLVLNDHGPVIEDLKDDMLNSYRGGCTDESLPAIFPDSAKADGTPGPNTCRLVQFAIFQQTAPPSLPQTGYDGLATSLLGLTALTGVTLVLGGWMLRKRLRHA